MVYTSRNKGSKGKQPTKQGTHTNKRNNIRNNIQQNARVSGAGGAPRDRRLVAGEGTPNTPAIAHRDASKFLAVL